MKLVLKIFVALFIISTMMNGCMLDEKQNQIEGKQDHYQPPPLKPMHIKDLSLINENKFPGNKSDSIWDLSYTTYKSLPELAEVNAFDYGEGNAKYYSNRTFSNNFKTYIFCISEGGDCGPSLTLMNLRNDTVFARKILYIYCGWERGDNITQSIFHNDSVFSVAEKGFGGGEIWDSITIGNKVETYKIASNGGFVLLDKFEKKWNEFFSREKWDDLRHNLKNKQIQID